MFIIYVYIEREREREREREILYLHMWAHQYYRYVNVIAASGYASDMSRVCIRYESGMHRGTHQVITLSVELGEGGFGAHPYV